MRSPLFEAYIEPARLYPETWRLIVGLLVVLLVYVGVFSTMLVAAYPALGPMAYFGWIMGLAAPATPGQTLFVLTSFLGMGLGVLIATPALHYREPGSLFGPARDWARGFFGALKVLVPAYALLFGLAFATMPLEANLDPGTWARMLPLALLLILIQTGSEELLFRGYLQQQLAARFAWRAVWMGLPALIFTALHYNPAAGMNNAIGLVGILAFALAAADLTERSGSLGTAMGWHFVNNVSSLLFTSVKGTITGLALFVTPFDVTDTATAPWAMALDLIAILLLWRLLRALI
ncbi:CPBP family intramembrane metalloprotease [Rhodovulum sulfidophilum]|uniref:CPBP family intramembrane glutamic endopeptidase n=1 Tax=Rhodovulum sulfidophilum TaxID=35806 RepID=UPI000951685F|nr:type II CAAX endopeptidase family protein [Rhodovulum sulfidophilum]MBK5925255.1 CPBP family intramembrane metalloprotease [Rhodovulum sulfidophilum]MBL3551998.1 CPBP family intramembrane metalloprotease [Rhodovulum sulfidophilum]MBL3560475.1 CPBP family intramembrane metalloprotease [Rhodovulum sulfidophilum]MBL3584931.1 CPBP family intramembrane metalloprotease [Rhodovulum sulfidophilum]MBL3597505.1 CPBP family intramembrane metalloprotease [Rhodovulum sulfidophilum]